MAAVVTRVYPRAALSCQIITDRRRVRIQHRNVTFSGGCGFGQAGLGRSIVALEKHRRDGGDDSRPGGGCVWCAPRVAIFLSGEVIRLCIRSKFRVWRSWHCGVCQ
jgi:hypothetical protein